MSSAEFGRPGKPEAISIDTNSITIKWDKPSCDVESYRVYYRQTGAEKLINEIIINGSVCACCVKNLENGIAYQIKVVAVSTTGSETESDFSTFQPKEYYDIVVLGKTGQGKSSLGNKLLNNGQSSKKWFPQADDLDIKRECKLMSNEGTNVRVLDVPGFSGSHHGKDTSVYEGNLQIIRWVVKEQVRSKLTIKRIVYFFPVRGVPEKADGTMLEELQCLYNIIGKDAFNCLVVAVTNRPEQRHQDLGFDMDDMKRAKEVLRVSLKLAIPNEDIPCPPVVYLGLNDTPNECQEKIKNAPVLNNIILPLKFVSDTCARCSVKFRSSEDRKEKISIILSDGTEIPHEMSKCHPKFQPKYSIAAKIAGGLAHIATLGICLLLGLVWWPGFTNSEEECHSCKKSPGSEGCKPVLQNYHSPEENQVDHLGF